MNQIAEPLFFFRCKMKVGPINRPHFCILASSKRWYMKSVSKSFLPEILINPISRNLIIIFTATLITAITLVTIAIVAFAQW